MTANTQTLCMHPYLAIFFCSSGSTLGGNRNIFKFVSISSTCNDFQCHPIALFTVIKMRKRKTHIRLWIWVSLFWSIVFFTTWCFGPAVYTYHISYLLDCKFNHQNFNVILKGLLNNKYSPLKLKKKWILKGLEHDLTWNVCNFLLLKILFKKILN